uniref:OO_Ba0005L10-OO_Ba0081K17.29 protein n=1 Tax=Oryza officinalis TaxID=4535 RepID=D0ABE0_9ORYZ|nr:OO_Ba0005L10-OO_Ba0081K17.29 [Oryza officinalis]
MPTRKISSVHQLRSIVWQSDSIVDFDFRVADNVSLDNARALWKAVSNEGGNGRLYNLPVLRAKDEAMKLVHDKLLRLRGWMEHVDGQLALLEEQTHLLEGLLDAGGPFLPPTYEAVLLDGPQAFMDIYQIGGHPDVGDHIAQIQHLYQDASLDDLRPPGLYYSQPRCEARELRDRRAMTRFNVKYLRIKRRGLLALKKSVTRGIAHLEKFMSVPTHLGSGNADYVGFVDVEVYPRVPPDDDGVDEDTDDSNDDDEEDGSLDEDTDDSDDEDEDGSGGYGDADAADSDDEEEDGGGGGGDV